MSLGLTACSWESKITSPTNTAGLSACTLDQILSEQCTATPGQIVTQTLGTDATSWSNPGGGVTVVSTLTDGYYQSKQCSFSDADLLATNIVSGVNIFGVLGTATAGGPYAACTDNAFNTSQCSTAANRYVYDTENGGRSANCSAGLNATACWTNAASRYVTATAGANVTGTDGSLSATIPTGYYNGAETATMSDTDLIASNIRSGVNLFGTTGTYIGAFNLNMASTAPRDPGVKVISNLADLTTTSAQLTLNNEVNTYAGAALPTTGGYSYRDIPSIAVDDEGSYGTNCKYAPRPSVNCGTSQTTIALRIADCESSNPTTSSWNGATQCNGGQGLWRLVSRQAANKEVWQDQRTGLLWSSVVGSANWCRSAGNTELTPLTFIRSFNNAAGTPMTGNGTIGNLTSGSSSNTETITITFSDATTFAVTGNGGAGGCQGGSTAGVLTTTPGSTTTYSDAGECSFTITQGTINFAANDKFLLQSVDNATYTCAPGGPLQPASPISYCAEAAGLTSSGENWGTGTYFSAKGGLGKNSTPGVRWRLPSIADHHVAEANGIRFVIPDMGLIGTSRPSPDGSPGGAAYEWTATVASTTRSQAWRLWADGGLPSTDFRSYSFSIRCVGR